MNCNWTDGDFELKLLTALELIYSDADRWKRALRNKNVSWLAHSPLLPSGIAYFWQCTFLTSKLPIFFVWIPFPNFRILDPLCGDHFESRSSYTSSLRPFFNVEMSPSIPDCSIEDEIPKNRIIKKKKSKSDRKLTDKTLF